VRPSYSRRTRKVSYHLITMAEDRYTIQVNGEVLFKSLSQDEYFDRMEDLALEYYQRGVPRPESIQTIIINENGDLTNGNAI
jgi:hypothetical protein